ncbi:ATP-binding protein [Coleofasciculus sp. FACHB-SPT36]|uniref:ATP-binding protein n=1 Tax=Coleofasciculus sp. FACHB-SPT36 TaxID=2692790 RepID=UPI00168AEE94|nr:ATP-binding protein [Coleofasciculus sp. FACHB-SPT36]MBD2541320.1 ATP-binding protein [Coleofasciculus sp. FACHB-SPT36]
MMTTTSDRWQAANQRYFMGEVARVRQALERQAAKMQGEEKGQEEDFPRLTSNLSPPATLEQLCKTFGLSDFERDILLLCVGMELDPSFPSLCAIAQGNERQAYPTMSLALAILPASHWDALTPTASLRRWQLIEVGTGTTLTSSPLRIDERILHYIAGVQHLDELLMGIIEPLHRSVQSLVPSHRQVAEQLAGTWLQASQQGSALPVVQLCGDETASKRAIASATCALLQLNLNAMSAQVIPTSSSDFNSILRLWNREAILSESVLLLDCDDVETSDPARENVIATLIEGVTSPIIVTSPERRRSRQRPSITIDVSKPTAPEQRAIWQDALGEAAESLNGHLDTLVSHFSLSAPSIYAVCTEAKGRGDNKESLSSLSPQSSVLIPQSSPLSPQETLSTLLWDTCRSQARQRLNDLAQPIIPGASWDELVLPEAQRQVLRDIAAHVRQRAKVYENWGFGGSGRGLGISALFAGGSGTGKTMAADVLAGELQLDLYRIDLSSVISKYIGETEKNLRRVFDAAEAGGAILLFDEADALFGKRSEVKDSHDRHANIEVAYLLQRMEAYRGLAILTTNLKGSLDQAFLRRIRFIVQFPFPDATQRAEIWQRIFPRKTPTEGLDPVKLARLNVAGGNIRNIALNAAFIAADANEPVGMQHILQAAKSEYVKLERPLTDAEVKGWV